MSVMTKGPKTKTKGQARVQKKSKSWHRARKPRAVLPPRAPLENNHAARHAAKKAAAVAHAAEILAEAEVVRWAAEEAAFQAELAAETKGETAKTLVADIPA